MATITGAGGVFKAVDTGGTLVAIAEVRSFSIDSAVDTIEVTSMGSSTVGRSYTAGLDASSLSVEMYFDTADSQADLTAGNIIDFELSPEGTGTGTVKYSGTGIVATATTSSSVDGMVEMSVSITVNNGLTKGTNA